MIIKVRLERIEDNPFQTRQVYDEAGIEELAADIKGLLPAREETLGLIQVPLGRLVLRLAREDPPERVMDPREFDGGEYGVSRAFDLFPTLVVQLAAGHRRVRAFRVLEQDLQNGADWASMPVDVGVLDDRAMADIAWSENAKRSDLSAIEEGAAIQRAMVEFGDSLAQVSERWGLSRSAASNKVRLLELPEKVQGLVREGKLGERHARELLPLVQVGRSPETAIQAARDAVKYGTVAAHVAADVERRLMGLTRFIDKGMLKWADWSNLTIVHGSGDEVTVCAATCKKCEHQTRGRCSRPVMYEERRDEWMEQVMVAAERKAGLRRLAEGNFWRYELGAGELKRARERRCEHLGLSWRWNPGKAAVLVDGKLPYVYYLCGRERGGCECRQAREELETGQRALAWKDGQAERAERIGVELFEDVSARMLAALNWVGDDDLGVFVALADRIGDVDFEVEGRRGELARAMADWMTGSRSHRYREGDALVLQGRVLCEMGIAKPVLEMRGWLQALRDELEAARVEERSVSGWRVKQASEALETLLERQPDDEVRGEMERLLAEAGVEVEV